MSPITYGILTKKMKKLCKKFIVLLLFCFFITTNLFSQSSHNQPILVVSDVVTTNKDTGVITTNTVLVSMNDPDVVSAATNVTNVNSSITLGWTASTDITAVGYFIYESTATDFSTNLFKYDASTNISITITNLIYGIVYYFKATSYDSSTNEGPPTDTLMYSSNNIIRINPYLYKRINR